jgi:hypothetical protein
MRQLTAGLAIVCVFLGISSAFGESSQNRRIAEADTGIPPPGPSTPVPISPPPVPIEGGGAPSGFEVDSSSGAGGNTNVQQRSGTIAPTVTSTPLPETPEGYQTYLPGRTKFNPRVPRFHSVRPQWGIHFNYGFNAFSGNKFRDTQTGRITAVSAAFEFQPAFIQAIGVIGLGPSFTLYPVIGDSALVSNLMGIYSIGAQVRYQARWFTEQIVVPEVGYAFEQFRYKFADGNAGYLNTFGPFFGIWLYLNPLDKPAAADFYTDFKGSRSYLVAEARLMSGADDLVSVSGMTLYAGFRIEFE